MTPSTDLTRSVENNVLAGTFRLTDAQDAYDEAVRVEVGWEIVGLVLNNEMRRRQP